MPTTTSSVQRTLNRLRKRLRKASRKNLILLAVASLLVLGLVTYATVGTFVYLHTKNDLQGQNDQLSQDNSDLQSKVNDLQSQNDDLNQQVQDLQSQIDDLQSQLDSASSVSTISIPSVTDVCGQIPSITSSQQTLNNWFACRTNWYHKYLPGQPIP